MWKMKIVNFFMLFLIMVGFAAQARGEGFTIKDLPTEGKSLADFVPKGWAVEDQASGDLNGDGVSDIAAVLVQSESEDGMQRALIILLGRGGDKFIRAGASDKVLQCKGCGGIKEGEAISIKKGVVVIDQWTGSREFAKTTWRFRYDTQTQRFVLIGKDIDSADAMRGTGKIESFNYLTGQKIIEIYHYDEKGERKIATSTKKEKGSNKTPFVEDVEPEF
jgi:hypothetical protein